MRQYESLTALAGLVDPALARYGRAVMEEHQVAAGLDRWTELSHIDDLDERLRRCEELAQARYDALPEQQRWRAPAEARWAVTMGSVMLTVSYVHAFDREGLTQIMHALTPLLHSSRLAQIAHEVPGGARDAAMGRPRS